MTQTSLQLDHPDRTRLMKLRDRAKRMGNFGTAEKHQAALEKITLDGLRAFVRRAGKGRRA